MGVERIPVRERPMRAFAPRVQALIDYLKEIAEKGIQVDYKVHAGFFALTFTGATKPFDLAEVAYKLGRDYSDLIVAGPIITSPYSVRFDFKPHL